MEYITFNSNARQDEFVARLLKFKRGGTFLDIGSHHSKICNNSYYFDNELDWGGVCVELDSDLINSYSNRKNTLILNQDATQIDYANVLEGLHLPNKIDYLSLDVDTVSLSVLKILPLDKYEFSVVTIEHDGYIYGDLYRGPQREILKKNGYFLLCGNVYVEQEGYEGKEFPFEDWWVHESLLKKYDLSKIASDSILPSQIIAKFNK